MPNALEKPQRFAQEYKQLADPVLRAHQIAMVVRDVEDVVGYGIFTMRLWFRWVEDWHERVSESSSRYNRDEQNAIDEVERLLLEVGEGITSLIGKAKTVGHEIERGDEFNDLYSTLKSCAGGIDPEFQRTTLREHFQKAYDEYKNGSLEDADNAWSCS
jgi:hypothetical protein